MDTGKSTPIRLSGLKSKKNPHISENVLKGAKKIAANSKEKLILLAIPHNPIVEGRPDLSMVEYPAFARKLAYFLNTFDVILVLQGGLCSNVALFDDGRLLVYTIKYDVLPLFSARFLVNYIKIIFSLTRSYKLLVLTFDVSHIFSLITLLFNKLLGLRNAIFIVTIPQSIIDWTKLLFCINHSNIVLTNHPLIKKILRRALPTQINKVIITIPNYPSEIFRDHGNERIPNSVIYVGRLSREKRVDFILRAFERVTTNIPDARLFVIGEGPLKEELQEVIKQRRMTKNVIFLGWLEQEEIAAWLSKCKVAVFASVVEFFPNVLIEAAACGTPVVTIDKPSYSWILKDAALYANPYSEDDFAENIIKLFRHKTLWLRLNEQGKKRAEDLLKQAQTVLMYLRTNYDWKKV